MRTAPRALLAVLFAAGLLQAARAFDVQELRSIGGLPPHLAGAIEEISACHLTSDGKYIVFDRAEHAVYSASPRDPAPTKIVQIGFEPGKVLRPIAFDSSPDGTFVVADAPGGRRRIQFFVESGASIGGFTLPGGDVPQVTLGELVISGISSVQYTGRSLLLSQPALGGLVTEYALDGSTIRIFGELRATGLERDVEVHRALNVGLPLVNPKGGFYYVFQAGVPMFRKYDAKGNLVFERHIEGVELDPLIRSLPTAWKPRPPGQRDEFPIVPATVRTAAVDPDGNLWVSLSVPFTYVYDESGDKRRTVQFRGAGIIPANGFFFTRDQRVLVTPGCYAFRRTG